jgi:large subunit ribosomal protein L16
MPLLLPARTTYRKQHQGNMKGRATRGATLAFGDFGLQALEPGKITARQIEAARIALTRYMKRGGKVWIRIFPQKPVTAKPAETRMGSGKGAVDHWIAVIKPGLMIFEIGGVSEEVAREAVRLAGHKLPLQVRFVKREEEIGAEA